MPPLSLCLSFAFTSSPSHLNICLALWWVPSCLTVSPTKRPTICSVVQNTLESATTYGWEGVRERETLHRPDECLYLPSSSKTCLHFTHLRCQVCMPPAKVVKVTKSISTVEAFRASVLVYLLFPTNIHGCFNTSLWGRTIKYPQCSQWLWNNWSWCLPRVSPARNSSFPAWHHILLKTRPWWHKDSR